MNLRDLHAPFRGDDLEWRIQRCGVRDTGEPWAIVVPYVTARAIMDRLDLVVGPGNWQTAVQPIGTFGQQQGIAVGIGIRVGDEWVWKWDASPATDIEPVKGAVSGGIKRAAVSWGMGRDLYGVGDLFARIHEHGKHYNKSRVKVRGQEQQLTFRWDPPELPAPASTAPAPAPVVGTPSGESPPSEKQLAFYRKLRESHHWTPEERAEQDALVPKLTRARIKGLLDYMTQEIKKREQAEREGAA